jgi:hypothetical protein
MPNNLIYTNHAIKKIGFYGLEKWQIEKVLMEPERVEWANVTNLKNVVRVTNHVEIGVTIKEEENGMIKIISVWRRNLYA